MNDDWIVESSIFNKRPKIQSILNFESTMEPRLQAADLGFFSALAMAGSLGAAAREMRITTAAVSKRLTQMESRLGVPLPQMTKSLPLACAMWHLWMSPGTTWPSSMLKLSWGP